MANVEDDSLSPDELKTPGEEPAAETEAAAGNETPAEPLAEEAADAVPEGEPVEAAEAEEPAEPAEEEEEEELAPSRLPLYLEIAALVAVPLALLALASNDILGQGGLAILSIWTAIYLIGLGLIAYGLWKARVTSTLYTVFLGCVLAAILTGVYVLWIEVAVNYRFDVNAQEAKRTKVGMVLPAEHYRLIAGQDCIARANAT